MLTTRSLAALLCAASLAACGTSALQDISAPATGARIKFFNFAVGAPGVNFYANDTKVTAISSATGSESTVGTAYTAVGNGGYYSAIAPGQYTLTGRISATTDNGLPIATAPFTLVDGHFFSMYLSGFYNSTSKTTDSFVLEDVFPTTVDFTVGTVRFVNASANAQPLQLYAKSTVTGVETAIGAPVAYESGTAFVTLPPASYDLNARYVGSNTNVITRTAVSFSGGRVYTVTAFGDITVGGTTATNRARLDNTTNR